MLLRMRPRPPRRRHQCPRRRPKRRRPRHWLQPTGAGGAGGAGGGIVVVVVVGAFFFWQTSPCCRCGTGGSGARVFGQRSCVSCRWLALNGKRGKHVSVSAWGSLKCACLRGVRGGVQVLFPSHPSSHCRGLVPASWLLFPVAKALSSAAPPPPPPPAAALGPTMRAQPHPQVA